MRVILDILRFLVFSNIWISLGASGLTYAVLSWNDIVEWRIVTFIGVATFTSYNFQRVVRHRQLSEVKSERHHWLHRHRNVLISMTFISSLAIAYYSWTLLDLKTVLLSFPFGLICLFYALPFGVVKGKAVRDIPYVKIFSIGLVWAYCCAILPNLIVGAVFDMKAVWLITSVFLMIVGITIPFDIRDLKYDTSDKKTLPQVLGECKAKILGVLLLVMVAIASVYLQWWTMSVASVVGLCLLLSSNSARKELFFSGLVDGILLLFWFEGLF